ncbi:MAG: hypothetical protein EOP20_07840 [Hyphomicrobiales bacterium]|nr:MAG: hypothetical protein EOP20_07840 [Hyphomicrobiales bacterium]
MIRTLIPALGFVLLLTGASQAAPFCVGASDGMQFSFSMSSDPNEDNDDRDMFDMMHLRQRGVDVTSVERWNGCIRAFVRKAEGGQEMQFFKPGSYIRVY